MDSIRKNEISRKKLLKEAVSHLLDKPWLSKEELEEINAIVSHWLQNPAISVPFLNNSIRNACVSFIQHYSSERGKILQSNRIDETQVYYQQRFKFIHDDIPYPPLETWDFTFIDLFAGIGGFRLAFQDVGGKCLFTSEWDKYAKMTYEANFGEVPYGDIRRIIKSEIPDHDVLCAGFPCQPFSLAGVSKKNSLGRKHGFEDEAQGMLFQ